MERIGTYPVSMQTAALAMLRKPEGGVRPIGLPPTPARIISKLDRHEIRAWEASVSRPYRHGVP
eukprot:8351531-Pyramimonas_sp.AAC.1